MVEDTDVFAPRAAGLSVRWRLARQPRRARRLSFLGSACNDAQRAEGAKGAALALVALAAALAPTPRWGVERWYSNGAYLAFQPYLTALSNRLPFALVDALLIGAAGGWVGALLFDLARRERGGWLRVAGRGVLRTIVLASALYLAFLLTWGLNYRRVPLAEKLQFDAGGVSAIGARQLAETAIDRLNALYDRAHARSALAADPLNSPLGSLIRTRAARARRRAARGAWPAEAYGARLLLPGGPRSTA